MAVEEEVDSMQNWQTGYEEAWTWAMQDRKQWWELIHKAMKKRKQQNEQQIANPALIAKKML
jgi:ABC-type nitrate/sulfonate/bicarbonate transport system substrate-binding protein